MWVYGIVCGVAGAVFGPARYLVGWQPFQSLEQLGRHASVESKLPRIAYLLRGALDAMSPRHAPG